MWLQRKCWESAERLLRDRWELAERWLRDRWETAERLLKDSWETAERLHKDCMKIECSRQVRTRRTNKQTHNHQHFLSSLSELKRVIPHIYDICWLTRAAGIPSLTVAVAEAGGAVGGPRMEAVVHTPLVSGDRIDRPACQVIVRSWGGGRIVWRTWQETVWYCECITNIVMAIIREIGLNAGRQWVIIDNIITIINTEP